MAIISYPLHYDPSYPPEVNLLTVLNRTVFTNLGPIVKKLSLDSVGLDLIILSPTDIKISSQNFDQSVIGKIITIVGTPSNRNNGTFTITKIINSKTLRLENACFDITNISDTTDLLITLVNELKLKYNLHLSMLGVHGTDDVTNIVTTAYATDLSTSITLLNDLVSKFTAHKVLISGIPPVHKTADVLNIIYSPNTVDLTSAILLVNELRKKYEAHRQNFDFHLKSDTSDRILTPHLRAVIGTGPLVGPFSWAIEDPELGLIADDPSDVTVLVNSSPASVDAVFGLLGAIVLTVQPNPGDNINIDYQYVKNPAVKIRTTNSFEYVFNQINRNGKSGLCIINNWTPIRAGASTGIIESTLTPNDIYKFVVQVDSAGVGQLISSGTVSVRISLDDSFSFGPSTLVPANGIFPLTPLDPYLPVYKDTGVSLYFSLIDVPSVVATRVAASTGVVNATGNVSFIAQVVSIGVGQLISGGLVEIIISLDGGGTYGANTFIPIDGKLIVTIPATPSNTGLVLSFTNTGSDTYDFGDSFALNITDATFDFGDSFTASCIGHIYPYRTYLIDPSDLEPDIKSPYEPFISGWKYKGFERAYSAVSNDPTTLISNVPTNKVTYDVLNEQVFETTVRYDPTTLPQNSMDPWVLKGNGAFSLTPGGAELNITDANTIPGPASLPPFFSHIIDLRFSSIISSAFRTRIDPSSLILDGVFTGVSFGISDGNKTILVGFIETNATNLSSAISLVNQVRGKYDAHLSLTGSHRPDDTFNIIDVVNATNLQSLIILVNRMKTLFNDHIALGLGVIHVNADVVNIIVTADATDLVSAILLINAIQIAFDAHRTQTNVHYVNDTINSTILVRQVGILTSGYPELSNSWVSYAIDWSQYITYRLVRNSNGSGDLYLSGSVVPIISINEIDLPLTADIDARIDPMQQVFFGTLGKQSVSTSYWAFIRVDIIPLDSHQISGNKSVIYGNPPIYVPELDPVAPWINLGQSGYTNIVSGTLWSDSTASADPTVVNDLGLTTGAYKGYVRMEPILTNKTMSSVEFLAFIQYWTFGVDNRSAGVFLDDGTFSIHFCFLQASPLPATIIGSISEPFGIVLNDTLLFSINGGEVITHTFTGPTPSLAAVILSINLNPDVILAFAPAPATFASASMVYPNNIQLTSPTVGASSKIVLIGGTALIKLGLNPGTYFGKDSNPEPRVSWFGENFPDQDIIPWSSIGNQSVELLNRTLRISDTSISDFKLYSLSNASYTKPVFELGIDWKLDARLQVLSYVAGDPVLTGSNLLFCGVLINIDEGINGKNIELQLAIDSFSTPYINILSYNSSTGNLDSIAEYIFNWTDNAIHSYNIFTNKNANAVFIIANDIFLGAFNYSSLNQGTGNPSINFGSGSNPVSNCDLNTARSVVDWNSICAFKDSKISDPLAASNRYVGLYAGGDSTVLNSYHSYQIDWTAPHIYRIVRDPSNVVSVFIDNNTNPVISVNYDPLLFPSSSSSFLSEITSNNPCIAFGDFNSFEISRSAWIYINYSIGKMTLTDLLIPPHNVLNQVNTVASSEHLKSQISHINYATKIWSGGTPSDDFLQDSTITSAVILGEGTPPFTMTQDLDSRGGPIYTQVPVTSISSDTFVDEDSLMAESYVVQVSIPDGVLYEAMRFFNFDEGETGHMSPFIDEAVGILTDTITGTVTTFTINSETQARRFPQYISPIPPPGGTLVPW